MEDEEKAWLEYAERDLGAYQKLVEGELCANACFHAQQAVEKALLKYVLT